MADRAGVRGLCADPVTDDLISQPLGTVVGYGPAHQSHSSSAAMSRMASHSPADAARVEAPDCSLGNGGRVCG
jgi:hypothetical protein